MFNSEPVALIWLELARLRYAKTTISLQIDATVLMRTLFLHKCWLNRLGHAASGQCCSSRRDVYDVHTLKDADWQPWTISFWMMKQRKSTVTTSVIECFATLLQEKTAHSRSIRQTPRTTDKRSLSPFFDTINRSLLFEQNAMASILSLIKKPSSNCTDLLPTILLYCVAISASTCASVRGGPEKCGSQFYRSDP